jgi:hypothetical protein
MKLVKLLRVWVHGARKGASISQHRQSITLCTRKSAILGSGQLPSATICQPRSLSSLVEQVRRTGTTNWSLAAVAATFGCVVGSELWRRHCDPTHSEAAEEKPSPDELKKALAPGKGDGLPLFTRWARCCRTSISTYLIRYGSTQSRGRGAQQGRGRHLGHIQRGPLLAR